MHESFLFQAPSKLQGSLGGVIDTVSSFLLDKKSAGIDFAFFQDRKSVV